jgi:hypothetical protein
MEAAALNIYDDWYSNEAMTDIKIWILVTHFYLANYTA